MIYPQLYWRNLHFIPTIAKMHVKIRLNHQIVRNLHAPGFAAPYLCTKKTKMPIGPIGPIGPIEYKSE